jgi:hypothetical protein
MKQLSRIASERQLQQDARRKTKIQQRTGASHAMRSGQKHELLWSVLEVL